MGLCSRRVAFDTNMLLAVPQFGVDVFGCIKDLLGPSTLFFVPRAVLEELGVVAAKSRKRAREVALAMKVFEANRVGVVETGACNADEALLELSRKGYYVASNDRALRKRIKKLGGKNIYLRKRKLVEVE